MTGHSGEIARRATAYRDQEDGPVMGVFEHVVHSADEHAQARMTLSGLTGPLPSTFDISSFPAPATTSTTPTLRTVTLDELVTLLTTHERLPDKDGRGWS